MAELIDKSAIVDEIEKLIADETESIKSFEHSKNVNEVQRSNARIGVLTHLRSLLNTLEVIDPYEQCVQHASIEGGIKAHAETYSFNIESLLFNQLTEEQQALWRKEIEQACISGGEVGVELARDLRYKENLEVKDVDLEKEISFQWSKFCLNGKDKDSFVKVAKHFFELGLNAQCKISYVPNIDDSLEELGVDPTSKGAKIFKESYYIVLEKLKAQKGNSMTDKEKLLRIKKLADEMYRAAQYLTTDASHLHKAMDEYHQFIVHDYHKEEPVSEDLEGAAQEHVTKEGYLAGLHYNSMVRSFKAGAQWQKNLLWKHADGDDLPEIDREVVAFQEIFPTDVDVPSLFKIVIAHRPNPEGYDGKSIATGEVEHYTPKTYDKGGWNIPDIKYWLDVELPKEIEP